MVANFNFFFLESAFIIEGIDYIFFANFYNGLQITSSLDKFFPIIPINILLFHVQPAHIR